MQEIEMNGGVLQLDDDGTIRFIDNHGNTESIWRPGEEDYGNYLEYFGGTKPMRSIFVASITVIDPHSKLPVEIEIRKLDNGLMVGLDECWLSSLCDNEQPVSPYDGKLFVVPDNEF